jgi:hypothetical protein
LEFKFAGGSKPASFQTERFSGAAINFTKADAAFCAALGGGRRPIDDLEVDVCRQRPNSID